MPCLPGLAVRSQRRDSRLAGGRGGVQFLRYLLKRRRCGGVRPARMPRGSGSRKSSPRKAAAGSRPRDQQRVQAGQRRHNADRQFHAQQRGRKPAEPARDAAGHHRSVADGQPSAHALRHGRSPHAPAADNPLREGIPARAEPDNDGSERPLHRIAPSSTPVNSTLSPKLPGTQSQKFHRPRPAPATTESGNWIRTHGSHMAAPMGPSRQEGEFGMWSRRCLADSTKDLMVADSPDCATWSRAAARVKFRSSTAIRSGTGEREDGP